MKQDELEQFVTKLAKAERDAAVVITQAEANSISRIHQHQQQLEHTHKDEVDRLLEQFEQEKQKLLKDIEIKKEALSMETQSEIAKFKRIHEAECDQLVHWLVDKVVQDP